MTSEAPLMKFVATVAGLEGIADVQPVPAKEFYPKWWKDVPFHDSNTDNYTVKACPAFPDYFSQGFVLPMWADSTLEYDPETKFWRWEVGRAGAPYKWSNHEPGQMLDHIDGVSHQGSPVNYIFKADCPWRIITPPGYSTLQLPMFYHFNNEFSVLPGVIRTDNYHEINQQVMLHAPNKKTILIPRGTPLVHYIPFKREELVLDVHKTTEEEANMFATKDLDIRSSKMGKLQYRKTWEN
jgi:hypothetical protein